MPTGKEMKEMGVELDQDGVNVAFDIIFDELSEVIDQLNNEGAALFKKGDYNNAQKLGETGKDLNEFRNKLSLLQQEWNQVFDRETRLRVKPEPTVKISKHKKSKKTLLSISFASGKKICYSVAADSFVSAISEMGIEAVKGLNLDVYGVPLVSASKHDKYCQHRAGEYFVITHTSTSDKKELLEKIAQSLGHKISVEIKETA